MKFSREDIGSLYFFLTRKKGAERARKRKRRMLSDRKYFKKNECRDIQGGASVSIPQDIYFKNLEIEMQGGKYLQEGDYASAAKAFHTQYDLLLNRQKKDEQRIHKGGPAHNLGIALLYQGESKDGLFWLLLAFIEDALSEEKLFDCENLPASRVLRGICGVNPQELDILETYVLERKKEKLVLDPIYFFREKSSLVNSIIDASSDYVKSSFKFELQGSRELAETKYSEAEETYLTWKNILVEFQEKRNVRLHKGHVIFQIGYSQLRIRKIKDSFANHRLAYIEDVLSERKIGDANKTAAYNNLIRVFGVGSEILAALERFVLDRAKKEIVMNPEVADKDFLDKGLTPTPKVNEKSLQKKYSISEPPGALDKRVFIGGSYVLMPILREIEKTVIQEGYQPIMARDFEMPKERNDEYCNRLVGMCKYAIFEVTLDSGHLIELQTARTTPFNIKTKAIFMAQDENKEFPKTMNSLVSSQSPAPEGYVAIEEIERIVKAFLKK